MCAILDQPSPANNLEIVDLDSLQIALYKLIPISKHMGIEAISYDGQTLVLKAPLSPNVNHQQSAFGGSLFSVAVLTGWSIVQLKLGELQIRANAVVKGGEVAYTAPVFEDIRCELTLPAEYPEFAKSLVELGRASMVLTSEIFVGADRTSAMTFDAKYVVKTI